MRSFAMMLVPICMAVAGCGSNDTSSSGGGSGSGDEMVDYARNLVLTHKYGPAGCDADVARKSISLVTAEYGTFDHAVDNYGVAVRLQERAPALKAVFRLKCMNRNRAIEGDVFFGAFVGNDAKFGVWRCLDVSNLTVYGADHNTPTGQYESYGGPTKDSSFEVMCGFRPK